LLAVERVSADLYLESDEDVVVVDGTVDLRFAPAWVFPLPGTDAVGGG